MEKERYSDDILENRMRFEIYLTDFDRECREFKDIRPPVIWLQNGKVLYVRTLADYSLSKGTISIIPDNLPASCGDYSIVSQRSQPRMWPIPCGLDRFGDLEKQVEEAKQELSINYGFPIEQPKCEERALLTLKAILDENALLRERLADLEAMMADQERREGSQPEEYYRRRIELEGQKRRHTSHMVESMAMNASLEIEKASRQLKIYADILNNSADHYRCCCHATFLNSHDALSHEREGHVVVPDVNDAFKRLMNNTRRASEGVIKIFQTKDETCDPDDLFKTTDDDKAQENYIVNYQKLALLGEISKVPEMINIVPFVPTQVDQPPLSPKCLPSVEYVRKVLVDQLSPHVYQRIKKDYVTMNADGTLGSQPVNADSPMKSDEDLHRFAQERESALSSRDMGYTFIAPCKERPLTTSALEQKRLASMSHTTPSVNLQEPEEREDESAADLMARGDDDGPKTAEMICVDKEYKVLADLVDEKERLQEELKKQEQENADFKLAMQLQEKINRELEAKEVECPKVQAARSKMTPQDWQFALPPPQTEETEDARRENKRRAEERAVAERRRVMKDEEESRRAELQRQQKMMQKLCADLRTKAQTEKALATDVRAVINHEDGLPLLSGRPGDGNLGVRYVGKTPNETFNLDGPDPRNNPRVDVRGVDDKGVVTYVSKIIIGLDGRRTEVTRVWKKGRDRAPEATVIFDKRRVEKARKAKLIRERESKPDTAQRERQIEEPEPDRETRATASVRQTAAAEAAIRRAEKQRMEASGSKEEAQGGTRTCEDTRPKQAEKLSASPRGTCDGSDDKQAKPLFDVSNWG